MAADRVHPVPWSLAGDEPGAVEHVDLAFEEHDVGGVGRRRDGPPSPPPPPAPVLGQAPGGAHHVGHVVDRRRR